MSLKILFVASECVPFVKTGGLADVVGALPKEIRKKGEDVRVILPLYRQIGNLYRDQMEHLLFFYVNMGWRRQYVGIETLTLNDVTYYFVDNEYYFGRSYIYGLGGDEGERYAYFCRAVLEALSKIDFAPDVIHLHDWQTGMLPAMLEIQYRSLAFYKHVRTVFTVHNLQYQGIFPIHVIEELVALGDLAYTVDHLEFYGQCSFMKGGLTFADKLTTVSETYASEIQSPYYGERLDGLLRSRAVDLHGIINGIDTDEYNPETDEMIFENYTLGSFEKKALNKRALQEELNLTTGDDIPMIGMVGRLSGQKGLDLVECVLDQIMSQGVQLVVLGMGEDRYVDLLNWAQWKYPGNLAARVEMNHQLAHKIYAASDMFLMPSLFEPCGLSQMIALRYGTLPIARETGGLRDTVFPFNEFTGDGNGFTFLNYNAHDMLSVVERAVKTYREHKDIWSALVERAMTGQYGWDQSATKYIALYASLAAKRSTRKPRAKSSAVEENPKRAPAKPRAKAAESAEKIDKTAANPRAKKAAPAEETAKPTRKPRAKKTAETPV